MDEDTPASPPPPPSPSTTTTTTTTTSQLLQDCLNIIQAPTTITTHPTSLYSNNTTRNINYNNHPDIQYFQKIKTKNHFNYHKSKHQTKWNIDKVSSSSASTTTNSNTTTTHTSKMSEFEPYNLDHLLARIKSFNSLNWKTIDPAINELKCALNGWKCVSFGIEERKNHLICTFCNQQLMLKSDDTTSSSVPSDVTPFDYNVMSGGAETYDEAFHEKLVQLYAAQIETTAHGENCLWRNFETPVEGIYYVRQYLPDSDAFLIKEYCRNLKNLIDNLLILQEYAADAFVPDFVNHEDEIHPEFVRISNQWILAKYFNDNKENFNNGLMSYHIPAWVYKLAVYGWSLNVQSYARDVILVMSCNMCNERVFLNSTETNTKKKDHDLKLSLSKILTPVVYPMLPSHEENDNEYDTTISEATKFDPRCHHKSWCSYLHNDLPLYFIEMVLESEGSIGPNGEYVYDNDLMNIDTSALGDIDDATRKRRKSFTVNEGLERLSKLRKLYLIDE
ncbi:hypothetical protein Cantr_09011 [Candida viswanathii]|uniref:C3HC-type domain-containing protein n=1 Tax=Candida viswanathii TaxID=5486 RepID=A0A367YCI5_9ASCO|nr:hypothetical protein Cantr_09011 [Candida viswanathii]